MIMIIFYNIILFIFLIVFSPLIFVKTIISPKYRGRIPGRFGFGLDARLAEQSRSPAAGRKKTIWIHALSVGEVLSAQPLVKGIRAAWPETVIVFSAATMTGEVLARQTMRHSVDIFVPFPLDLLCSVKYFLRRLRPDLFILIETDLWPNFIYQLKKKNIPSLLINGRISEKSFAGYRKLRFFFLPLFASFRFISMQTAADAEKIIELGVPRKNVRALGNLKYDAVMPEKSYWRGRLDRSGSRPRDFSIPPAKTIWIAGSTHPGEEAVVLAVFKRLALLFPDLFLVVAPRQVDRGREITETAQRLGLTSRRRSKPQTDEDQPAAPILILDTMGELSEMYEFCDIAFIGGSLVPDGGHNPLEPAAFGKAIIFGPHMNDFTEISRDLLENKAAVICSNEEELFTRMQFWLAEPAARMKTGLHGLALVNLHQGVTARHVELIRDILQH